MNLYSNQLARVKHREWHWSGLSKSRDENEHIRTRAIESFDMNSLGKRTQALTDMHSDSLSAAPFVLNITIITFHYITLFTPTIFAASWGVMNR